VKRKAKSTAAPYKIALLERVPLGRSQKLGAEFKNRVQKLPGYQKLPG
jgi:hypothetical protein